MCFGIAACAEDDQIVGTWFSRNASVKFSTTFDNDGRFVMIEDNSIVRRGTYDLSPGTIHFHYYHIGGEAHSTWIVTIIGDVMIVEFKDGGRIDDYMIWDRVK